MAYNFDVVISGISGRFPECSNVDTFKKKLYSSNSSTFITSDERKWLIGFKMRRYHDKEPIPQAIGKYINPDDFDFRVFHYHQNVARSTSVLNRKVLEVAYESIVDAGINPSSLSGANIGVFMACGIGETDPDYFFTTSGKMFLPSSHRSMGPNRVSFALNLSGPSYAINSDPLGSIEVLKLAKTMIQDGSIEAAIVVAVNHICNPKYSYLYKYLKFLTSEEICRSFDENANGFVRSESSVALYLQREQDAKRIYAKINFCDSLYEGLLSHTLLGYDEEYLRNCLLKIYERNGGGNIAKDLAFLELTGSAVKKLDTIESNAVADILFKWRKNSLPVGSIKSVIGHTESSSPLVSLLKIIFAFESKTIAPNKNFEQPNENIRAFRENKFQVIDKTTKLSGDHAAVNTIGLFGSVNHIVLQRNIKESEDSVLNRDSLPRLLLLSGRTAEGLEEVFDKIHSNLKNVNAISMANDVFGTYIPFHVIRGFTILSSTELVVPWVKVYKICLTGDIERVIHIHVFFAKLKGQSIGGNFKPECKNAKRPTCFVFSGMGSQWNGMGKELMNLPVFANAIKRCDAVLRPRSIDIYDIILSDKASTFDNITMSFVGIICMQIALFEVLKQLKIKPDIILGHSTGENCCAYADGCITLEQAVLASLVRGTVFSTTKLIKGMMAAIGLGYIKIKDYLPESIEVACHNSATSCTISGPVKDVNNFVAKLRKQDIFAKAVNSSNIAFHSTYIQALGPKLQKLLEEIIPNPKKRSSKWISSSVPKEHWSSPSAQTCSAEYLTNNLLSPVLFEEALKHIPKNAIVIEIAPHGLLQAILRRALPVTCTNISLTQKSEEPDNLYTLLTAIGRLYIAGCDLAVNNLYPPIEYPVPRGTPSISPYCTWFYGDRDAVQSYIRPQFPVPLASEKIVVRINEDSEFGFLKYHKMNDKAVIPASFFLYIVWRMLSIYENVKMDEFPILFENILSYKNVTISITKPRVFKILIQSCGSFEVLSRAMFNKKDSKVVQTGKVEFIRDENKSPENNFTLDCKKFEYNEDAINKILRDTGFQLGKGFQSLKDLSIENSQSTANIQWDGNWITFLDAALKFQMISNIHNSKPRYLHRIQRISISPSIIGSIPQGSKICCNYDKATKQFLCNGIEMYDAKWKVKHPKYTNELSSPLKLRKLRFISHNNPALKTVDEFLELCLQLATEDFQTTYEADLNLNICDITKQFIKSIKNSNCIRNLTQFKVSYKDLNTLLSKKLSGNEKLFLITEDDQYLANDHLAADMFVLLITSKLDSSLRILPKFTPLLSQNFSGKIFCLLKKNFDSMPEIRIEDSNDILPLADKNRDTKNEVIVRSKLNSSNLSLMLSRKHRSKSRYLFVSNTKDLANDCKPRVVAKAVCNLPVSVLKDQDWGTYRFLQAPEISTLDAISTHQRFNNIEVDSIKAEYVHYDRSEFEPNDVQSDSEIKLLGVEYFGWNEAGEKIMGLASTCSSHPVAKMDPILQWKVLDVWELTEAVTVPAIYVHVYSVMEVIERSILGTRSSIVIITDGQNIFAESLISLCTARDLTIYCVVPDEENAKDLKTKIPKLNESNVIINRNNNFYATLLLKTEGRRINIVVNFSADFKNMIPIMYCTTSGGLILYNTTSPVTIIETVETYMNERNAFGMKILKDGGDFFAIPCRITYFLSLREDRKIYLQNAIKQGIVDGFVRPVFQKPNTTTFEGCVDQQTDVSSNKCNTKSQIPSKTDLKSYSQTLEFMAHQSYIIIAGGERDDTWLEIIQWLEERDAMHFVVVVEKIPTNPRISSQINSWFSNEKITISFYTLNEFNSFDNASRIIDEITKLAPIDSIFFVHMESSSSLISYLDNATKAYKRNVKFISLFAGGVEEMEVRQSKGQPSFVIHGENFPKNLSEVLTDFEKMLITYKPDDNQSCLYEILESSNISDQLNPLRLVLPKSIDDLERIGRKISNEIKFVEMTSRCAKLADCKGVYPIFIIPSLHALQLESFCKSLMYPVFCASLTGNSSSVRATAFKLHEHLNVIQKAGPVTIVGETWNAAIAIELSLLIKESGRDFKVFVLEGNPNEWKNTITFLNLMESQQFDEVLTMIYGDQIQDYLQARNSLEADDRNGVINRVHNKDHKINSAHVHRCLMVLKQQILNVHNYNSTDSMIENAVFFSKKSLSSYITCSF